MMFREVLSLVAQNGRCNMTLRMAVFIALLAAFSGPVPADAQETEIDVATTTRVSLGKTSASPEETAMVPVYFIPPKSIPVGRLKLDVSFVSVNLKFDRVEPGPVADSAKVHLSAQVTPGKNENGIETSTVALVATVPEQSADSLPAGLLAYITLRVTATARPAKITLKTSAEATRPGSTDPLPDVRSFGAEVEVMAPGYSPTVVCFFFTH